MNDTATPHVACSPPGPQDGKKARGYETAEMNKQGIASPVELNHPSRSGAGLGRRSNKTPKPKRKGKTYHAYLTEDGKEIYGTYQPITETFQVHTFTTQGRLIATGETHHIHESRVRDTLRWGRGIVGIAESHFPHPAGWTLAGTDCDISRATVKKLTNAFQLNHFVEPSCIAAWEKRLGPDIKWKSIGLKYRQRMLTPRDFMTHYKLILHRGLLTRNIQNDCRTTICRVCEGAIESIAHLSRCPTLDKIWQPFLALCGACNADENPRVIRNNCFNELNQNEHDRLILLGATPIPIPQALSDLHLIIWKFILINFTQVDLSNIKFSIELTLTGALRRYVSKVNALAERLRLRAARCEAREEQLRTRADNEILFPLARIEDNGDIVWDYFFKKLLDELVLAERIT